jgi:tRNA(Ile)-lysidine synthase TilS/MesJ
MDFMLRDLYESYTRDVRYASYKSIPLKKLTVYPQVVMGHNKDDRLENIMTNIAHKNKYENLCGMLPISTQDNIRFLRPLLNTTKLDIIKFAKENNIPFLPNSTPSWSQRGQIRNTIVPCLDNWNENFVPSLFNVSETMSSLYKVLQSSVSQFINRGEFKEDTFTNEKLSLNELLLEEVFWKETFINLYSICPSSKSTENLVCSLNKYKLDYHTQKEGDKRKVMINKHIILETSKCDDKFLKLKIYKIFQVEK